MDPYDLRILIQAMSIMVRVEGLKAANQQREHRGESIAYDEDSFDELANELDEIVKKLIKR